MKPHKNAKKINEKKADDFLTGICFLENNFVSKKFLMDF